jgi:hypothetical protein
VEAPKRATKPKPQESTPDTEARPATAETTARRSEPGKGQSVGTHTPARTTDTPPRTSKSRKNHPIVPSWEDVLLGVRTQRN